MDEIISHKKQYYQAGKIAKEIILKVQDGKNSETITNELNTEYQTNYFNIELINDFISNKIGVKKNKNSIKLKFSFYNPEKHILLFKKLTYLFDYKVSVFIIITFILLTFYLYNTYSVFDVSHQLRSIKIYNILIAYVLSYIIMFIHEIGHAVASIKYNIIPKKIGFGFYFIIPVLYTDLTAVWKLNKWKKIEINLGGVYFQLIVGILLTITRIIIDNQIIDLLIITNITMLINVFNPIFKYDGYWIYSDYFEISNLRQKSNEYISNFFQNNNVKKNWPLVIYSFASIIFTLFQIYILTLFTIFNFNTITKLNHSSMFEIFKYSFSFILNSIFIYIFIIKIYHYLFKRKYGKRN